MKTSDSHDRGLIFEKLENSPLYLTYKQAFRDATGLPLTMVFANGEGWQPCLGAENQNKFCQMLNESGSCDFCRKSDQSLCSNSTNMTRSVNCFAGLLETAVPVRCSGRTVAFLKTGQVFNETPGVDQVEKVMTLLVDQGFSPGDLAKLREYYEASDVVETTAYHGMITLLTAFALQLGELVNRIVLEEQREEPAVVSRAKQFILEHLDEPLSLDRVAGEVGVSSFYFCKLFKQSTRLTYTEFVNRQRVEWAKKKLLDRGARITEVAFDVGYQSLSQFNRSFARIVGESPTQYRHRLNKAANLQVA